MRTKTGIEGLDRLTLGGFPEKTANLLAGPAGSAKTLLGLQYVHFGAKELGEAGLYLSLEEPRDNILRTSHNFGFELSPLEKRGLLSVIDYGEVRREQNNGEMVGFGSLTEFLKTTLSKTKFKRLTLDSLSALSISYSRPEEHRSELFKFLRFLKEQELTAILISEFSGSSPGFDAEQFLSDSLIMLGYENVHGEYRRTITVYKMRFTKHDPYKHPFLITKNGIDVDFAEVIS